MKNWNKRKIVRVGIILAAVVLIILTGRCAVREFSKSSFQQFVERYISNLLESDMKCESQDIGTVEHVACQGNYNKTGFVVVVADYPDWIVEFVGYTVLEDNSNMVTLKSCQGRLVDTIGYLEINCPSRYVHISEAVNRLDKIQADWESGQLRLSSN